MDFNWAAVIAAVLAAALTYVLTRTRDKADAERQHQRWLRDRRLAAYLEFQQATVDVGDLLRDLAALFARAHEENLAPLVNVLLHRAEAITLVGPDPVRRAMAEVVEVVRPLEARMIGPNGVEAAEIHDALGAGIAKFNVAARKAIGVLD